MLLNLLSSALLLAAGFVAFANWVLFWRNNRNARLGSGGHVSMVFLAAQILAGLAWLISQTIEHAWLPGWTYLIVLGEPSFLLLCALPFVLLWRTFRARRSGGAS
jgi:hypothetical protein